MRSHVNNSCMYYALKSQFDPKTIPDALVDEGWLLATQEELILFKRNDVWVLVPCPYNKKSLELDECLGKNIVWKWNNY